MGTVQVEVKWGKEVFKDVEIDTTQPPTVFKSQLFSLTGVPPERQKIMGVKGGLLKDDADWAKLGLKAGQKLSMMGTADKVPEAPVQQQTFMEDLPEEEQDTSGAQGQGRAAGGWRGRASCQRTALSGGAVGTPPTTRTSTVCCAHCLAGLGLQPEQQQPRSVCLPRQLYICVGPSFSPPCPWLQA